MNGRRMAAAAGGSCFWPLALAVSEPSASSSRSPGASQFGEDPADNGHTPACRPTRSVWQFSHLCRVHLIQQLLEPHAPLEVLQRAALVMHQLGMGHGAPPAEGSKARRHTWEHSWSRGPTQHEAAMRCYITWERLSDLTHPHPDSHPMAVKDPR
ncbi:hypothetical protein Z043_121140 [Scleropages formosus]|uniref:Uncharacterized protein n=1 Tax=Scleropages formosus TaxID=113540 RepID=A0A0P7TIU1_SCLFO|nr:hypothetical protein Z043_121140 [Scleropages formosus]